MKLEIGWEKVAQAPSMKLPSFSGTIWRAKVPGGWLVSLQIPNGSGLTFYPDLHHVWGRDSDGGKKKSAATPDAEEGSSKPES